MNGCCRVCYKQGTLNELLKVCSRCHIAKYCCTECQRKDWPTHKQECTGKNEESFTQPKVDSKPKTQLVPMKTNNSGLGSLEIVFRYLILFEFSKALGQDFIPNEVIRHI